MTAPARRKTNFNRFGEVQRAMFDAMIDGGWTPTGTVLAAGSAVVDAETAAAWGARERKNAASADQVAASGARSKARNDLDIAVRSQRAQIKKETGTVRLSPVFAAEWREFRGVARPAPARPANERVIAGWAEFDAWEQAPLQTRDQVHFRPNREVDLRALAKALPDHATLRVAPDGQHQIDCRAGTGPTVAQRVGLWLDEDRTHHDGVRIEHGLRRRDLKDLPGRFLDELCRLSFGPAKSRLAGSLSSLRVLVSEQADADQLVRLWILEAAAKFDHEKGVPFGGYLSTVLPRWVHDLNRASHGRTAADHELRYQRAMTAFQTEHHRNPTDVELADAMGTDVTTLRRTVQNVATLQGLRHQQPLLAPDEGGYEPPSSHDTAETVIDDHDLTLVSQALVMATLGGQDPNPLGFLAHYFTHWGEWTKSDLARAGRTSVRSLNARAALADESLRERLVAAGLG